MLETDLRGREVVGVASSSGLKVPLGNFCSRAEGG